MRIDPQYPRDALCADVDPEVFFPTAENGPALDRQVAQAKAICAECPVRDLCLVRGMNEGYGIWGGLTADERRDLRRRPARRTAAIPAA